MKENPEGWESERELNKEREKDIEGEGGREIVI